MFTAIRPHTQMSSLLTRAKSSLVNLVDWSSSLFSCKDGELPEVVEIVSGLWVLWYLFGLFFLCLLSCWDFFKSLGSLAELYYSIKVLFMVLSLMYRGKMYSCSCESNPDFLSVSLELEKPKTQLSTSKIFLACSLKGATKFIITSCENFIFIKSLEMN